MTLHWLRVWIVNRFCRSKSLEDVPENPKDGWLWRMVLFGVFGLLIAGCSLTVPSDAMNGAETVPATDVLVAPPADDIWSALAQAVRAKTIGTTARLGQYVLVLARNGQLSERDVSAFDAAFPQIAAGPRDLTEADVGTLLNLGRKGKL